MRPTLLALALLLTAPALFPALAQTPAQTPAQTLAQTPAQAPADDRAACLEGIAMIRAELARPAPEAAQPKLKKALRVAERELGEGEFDECLDAVGDARRALKP